MDKAEMLDLISKLTHQNTTKDGEIAALKSAMTRSLKETGRLEAKVEAHHLSTTLADERLTAMTLERDHFINKAHRLETSLTSIAAQEESTLATIQAVTQTTLSAAKAAINQATDQISSADDADEIPPPPPPSSPTIAAALSTARLDIITAKTTVHHAITIFFHMRHFLLVKRGFPSLLAETPVRCPVVVDDESFSPLPHLPCPPPSPPHTLPMTTTTTPWPPPIRRESANAMMMMLMVMLMVMMWWHGGWMRCWRGARPSGSSARTTGSCDSGGCGGVCLLAYPCTFTE
jgi:regulator of replication initiation timing